VTENAADGRAESRLLVGSFGRLGGLGLTLGVGVCSGRGRCGLLGILRLLFSLGGFSLGSGSGGGGVGGLDLLLPLVDLLPVLGLRSLCLSSRSRGGCLLLFLLQSLGLLLFCSFRTRRDRGRERSAAVIANRWE
jgi:hypothetical protein